MTSETPHAQPPPPAQPNDIADMRVAIVVSRFNASITDRLLEGAIERFAAMGGQRDNLVVLEAPGAFELPVLCRMAARSGRFSAVVALGCLIRGQTRHDRHIARAVAHGLVEVAAQTGVPVTFGVLTCETPDQARARAGGSKGNKGADALAAAVEAARIIASFERDPDALIHRIESKATDKATDKAIIDVASVFSSASSDSSVSSASSGSPARSR